MKASKHAPHGVSAGALLTSLLALTAVAVLSVCAAPAEAAMGDNTPAMAMAAAPSTMPTSVLLFPAVVSSDSGTSTHPVVETIVTDAVRRFLSKGGVGTVVYNRRLPAVERAVAEGLRPEDAQKGPGDDPRKAKTFADMLGAAEYLTVTIDDYKYDPASRTATFNLSVSRNSADGGSLGATAQKAIGVSPADIQASRQEAFAATSASDVVAEQIVESLYPGSAGRINPPKAANKKKRHGFGNLLIPAAAVVAALIGVNG